MEKMGRRTFLKGAGYTVALVTAEAASGKCRKAWAACSAHRPPKIYSAVQCGIDDPAGFDFYTDHRSRQVAAGPGKEARTAVFDISLAPIASSDDPVLLSAFQKSGPGGFAVSLNRESITLKKSTRTFQCRITAPPEIPEQSEALFQITGRRGADTQELTLRVTVLTAAPRWKMGQSETRVYDQPQQVTTGEPVRFHLALANRGHVSDRFGVSVDPPDGWTARLTDQKGKAVTSLEVGPVSGMFLWEYPQDIWLEATPGKDAPRKQNTPIVVRATSTATGFSDEHTVHAFYSEPLFALNDQQGMDPRRHYIRPGACTSFVLHLHGNSDQSKAFHLKAEALPPGWRTDLPDVPIPVQPGKSVEHLLLVTAPTSATPGEICRFKVSATDDDGNSLGTVHFLAEVTTTPKVYMLVIDSLDYKYLNLNRNGDGPGKEGDWLCPNIRSHMKTGTSFTRAECGMPAATDMNHTTIVSGATTGTLGAYWVSGYYAGVDEVGDLNIIRPSPDILRYGSQGKPLARIFDLLKQRLPDARSVVISNKPWVSHLHADGDAVKWGITGNHFPVYAYPPPPYVLGDPPTDANPKDRRPIKPAELVVNGNPIELLPQVLSGDYYLLKAVFQDIGEYIGSKPGAFPDDRWIADTACRVIREEDPEVLYVNLAATDEAGHLYGAAWDPDEWKKAKGLLFGSHWVSKYSEQARREEILDVVREADTRFGQIIAEIESRNMRDHSLIVCTADHSMVTEGYHKQGYAALDIKEYLRSHGIISPKHYGTAWALNHWATVFDVRDDATREEIKKLLQALTVDDPDEGPGFHPCIVLDGEGMKSGIDADNPYLPEAEKRITMPDELYSEYYIHHARDSIHWPEICIFFRRHYQAATPGEAMIRGVNGMGERVPLLAKTSNRLVGIHGSRLTMHVPMIFSGPGIKAGKEIGSPARLHDILPTLCHLLGWETPETVAGVSRREIQNV